MAHFLDRIFFTALTVATAFVITLNSTGSIPAAMIAGFLAPHPLRLLLKWVKHRLSGSRISLRRARQKKAAETVRCWSVLRDESCRNDILTLLQAAYPVSAGQMCFAENAPNSSIPVYPMLTLRPISEDAMADCLRRIRESGADRAVIASTSPFSPEARALVHMAENKSLALIDSDMLCSLLTKHPSAVPFRRLPHIPSPRPKLTRAHISKILPTSIFLLLIYFLFDLPLYLPAALTLLWITLLLLKRKPAPATLFP